MAFNFFGSDMSNLFQEIRQLCARHGYRAVHDGLQQVMQEDYLVLKGIFEGTSPLASAPEPAWLKQEPMEFVLSETIDSTPAASVSAASVAAASVAAAHQQQQQQKKKVTKAKKKEVEQPEYAPPAEMFSTDMLDGLADTTKLGTIRAGTEIVVSKLGHQEEPEVKPTFFTAADERAWQKEEEAKTKAKLDATGIKAESLLTRENLEQWIQKEKKGYAYVARRHVGLPESSVVAACKEMGIVSEAAKRRQAIVASRVNAKRGRGR